MEAKIHKPVLIVIAGPNGSGKTTITSRVLHHEWLEDSIYINPDNIAQNMFGDWNNQDAVLKAAQYCQAQREECLNNKHSMIFETVMSTAEKNASRIATRVMKGGHDVPITKIISRYAKSIINCEIASQYADRTYVYDNSKDGVEAQLLFRMTEGKIFKEYVKEIPEWAIGIANKEG